MTLQQEVDIVSNALVEAKKYGLETEVVLFALHHMKRDSTLSVGQAITYGLEDWVK